MRGADSPLAINTSLTSYVISSCQLRMSAARDIDAILGATSSKNLGTASKLFVILTWSIACSVLLRETSVLLSYGWIFLIPFIIFMIAVFYVRYVIRRDMDEYNSAYSAPERWYDSLIGAVLSIPTNVATHFVRGKSWKTLVRMAMGLDGYRFEFPTIEQQPNSSRIVTHYEDMPKGAEQRALDKRDTWIRSHLGEFSQTFSKLAITTADITSLLRAVEADQTLVHAAYYTDDDCIYRIADWIANGPNSGSQSAVRPNETTTR